MAAAIAEATQALPSDAAAMQQAPPARSLQPRDQFETQAATRTAARDAEIQYSATPRAAPPPSPSPRCDTGEPAIENPEATGKNAPPPKATRSAPCTTTPAQS